MTTTSATNQHALRNHASDPCRAVRPVRHPARRGIPPPRPRAPRRRAAPTMGDRSNGHPHPLHGGLPSGLARVRRPALLSDPRRDLQGARATDRELRSLTDTQRTHPPRAAALDSRHPHRDTRRRGDRDADTATRRRHPHRHRQLRRHPSLRSAAQTDRTRRIDRRRDLLGSRPLMQATPRNLPQGPPLDRRRPVRRHVRRRRHRHRHRRRQPHRNAHRPAVSPPVHSRRRLDQRPRNTTRPPPRQPARRHQHRHRQLARQRCA